MESLSQDWQGGFEAEAPVRIKTNGQVHAGEWPGYNLEFKTLKMTTIPFELGSETKQKLVHIEHKWSHNLPKSGPIKTLATMRRLAKLSKNVQRQPHIEYIAGIAPWLNLRCQGQILLMKKSHTILS